MRETQLLMGMPITIEILDKHAIHQDIVDIFTYFTYIDNVFSTYKEESEITRINCNQLPPLAYSSDMQAIFKLCEQTKHETNGYFDITREDGTLEPAGLVKGWAIQQAAKQLTQRGIHIFYIDAGGDIQVSGKKWHIGIRNPFNRNEIIKTVQLTNEGVATSGTYVRGNHIYNPHNRKEKLLDIISITIIGPNIYEADRFATAAFAMGRRGINFIESLSEFEGYMIDRNAIATYTSGFNKYVKYI